MPSCSTSSSLCHHVHHFKQASWLLASLSYVNMPYNLGKRSFDLYSFYFFAAVMSVSLKELCQMVNVPYDQARALMESESSDGESVAREEVTVVEDTVVHAGRVNL